MSLKTVVIQDNQVAGRGFLGTTVNSEDATKNCSHIHHVHIHHIATCVCITMLMVCKTWEMGEGEGGGG